MHTNTKHLFSEGQHFALNARFNSVGGNPAPAAGFTLHDVVLRAQRQIDLVRSEYNELTDEGVTPQNTTLIRDGVADVIVTIDGLYHRLGLAYPHHIHDPVHFELIPETNISAEVEGALTSAYIALNVIDSLVVELARYSGAQDRGEALQLPASVLMQQINVWANCILLSMHAIGYALHFDLIEDQRTVYASNMSKFTQDPAVAEQGVAKYAALEVPAGVFPIEVDGEQFYVVKCIAEGPIKGLCGGDYSPGKILKGVNFHKPQWTALSEAAERRFGILFGTIEPIAYDPVAAAREIEEATIHANAYGGAWALEGSSEVEYYEVTFESGSKEKTLRFYNVNEPILGRVHQDEDFSEGPVKKYTAGDFILIPNDNGDQVEVQLLKVYRHFPAPTLEVAEIAEAPAGGSFYTFHFDPAEESEVWENAPAALQIYARQKLEDGTWGETQSLPASQIREGMSIGVETGPLDAIRFATVTKVETLEFGYDPGVEEETVNDGDIEGTEGDAPADEAENSTAG